MVGSKNLSSMCRAATVSREISTRNYPAKFPSKRTHPSPLAYLLKPPSMRTSRAESRPLHLQRASVVITLQACCGGRSAPELDESPDTELLQDPARDSCSASGAAAFAHRIRTRHRRRSQISAAPPSPSLCHLLAAPGRPTAGGGRASVSR